MGDLPVHNFLVPDLPNPTFRKDYKSYGLSLPTPPPVQSQIFLFLPSHSGL